MYPDHAHQTVVKIAAVILLAGAAVAAVGTLYRTLHLVGAHADVTHPESAVVYNALLTARTGRVYPPISRPPYTPAVYGPPYYLLLSGIAKLGNLDFDHLLLAGRGVSLGAFALVVALAYGLARTAGANRLAALLTATFVLAEPDFIGWNVSARPDLLALALTLAAVLALLRASRRVWLVAAAGLGMSLAVLSKVSFSAAPVAVIVWLTAERRWRELGAWLAGAVVPLALTMASLVRHGDPLLGHLPLLNLPMKDTIGALKLLLRDLGHYWPHMLTLTVAVGVAVRWLSVNQGWRFALALYWVLAWVLAALGLPHVGGNVNYLLEPWVLSAVLMGAAVGELRIKSIPQRWAALAVCLVVAISGGLRGVKVARQTSLPDYAAIAAVVEHRRVLTDVSYLAAHSREPVLLDTYFSNLLEISGRWEAVPILSDLREQRFDVVILALYNGRPRSYRNYAFLSPNLLRAIHENYTPYFEMPPEASHAYERVLVLLPNGRPRDEQLAADLRQTEYR